MKSKRILTLVIISAMLSSMLVACSNGNNAEEAKAPVTQVVTEAVTDDKGEAVTEENGEAVTEVVTDANGDTVTEVVSTTEAQSSTTSTQGSTNAPGVSGVVGTTKSTTIPKADTPSNPSAPGNVTLPSGTTSTSSPSAPSNPTTPGGTTTTSQPGNGGTTTTTTKPAQPPADEEQVADDAISIVLEKNMLASCKSPNVSIAKGEIVVDKPGDYVITQNTPDWHGQIIIKLKNTEKASFRFENVHISNTTKNIIQILDSSIKSSRSFLEAEAATDSELENALAEVADNDKAPNVSLSFPRGTSSTLTTSANAFTGVIYNESKLTIKGNGSAKIFSTKNANNCICSTKSVTIKNLGLTLETAHNTTTESLAKTTGSAKGIFSYSKVTVESGFLTIKSNGDAIRCDRFYMNGGTANLKSSACDGIDTDDSIIISGGTISSTALEKYCYKVRRVNNTEKGDSKGTVRAGKDDCFRINGGKVTGEGKKITSLSKKYQSDNKDSKQGSLTAKIIKLNAGTDDAQSESKVPGIIKIGSWKSNNPCTKFLYSSSGVEVGKEYTATANGNSSKVSWNGKCGVALIKNSTNA